MSSFTKQQLEDWKRYEEVRAKGTWNMLAPEAQDATGLTRDEYMFVLKNYAALRDAVKRNAGQDFACNPVQAEKK